MDKKNENMQDDRMKALLSGAKVKAGANLKFRIMQQIETESVLAGKRKSKSKSIMPLIWNMLSVLGIMYGLISVVAAGVFFTQGQSALESFTFYVPVILIISVCGLFLMISTFDDKRRSKKHSQST